MPIEAPAKSTLTAEQIESFERNGYLIVSGLFKADEVEQIRATFLKQTENGPVPGLSEIRESYAADDPLARYPRMMNPHTFADLPVGPVARNYLLDARLHDILSDLYREEPVGVQTMFYWKPPGARGQSLHQDNFFLRVAPGTCMAAWLSVDDSDPENGGMVVVPGTHDMAIACPEAADQSTFFTNEHVAIPEGLEEVPIRMKAGDCLLFNGSIIHGSYPNTSKDRFRRALIAHYAPAASTEISHWYKAVTFNNAPLDIPEATGGGPCGTVQEPMGPH